MPSEDADNAAFRATNDLIASAHAAARKAEDAIIAENARRVSLASMGSGPAAERWSKDFPAMRNRTGGAAK